MDKETRKFIWGFFWMLIGTSVAVEYLSPAINNESLFTTDMLLLVVGVYVGFNGYLKADSTT